MKNRGFTLIELIIVIAIIGTLSVAALPFYRSWIASTEYRTAARDFAGALRLAKGRAISNNREYELSVNLATDVYLIREGERATGSSSWTTVAGGLNVPESVDLRGDDCTENSNTDFSVQFNPNGTTESTSYNVCVMDKSGNQKYVVSVNRMGRITMP